MDKRAIARALGYLGALLGTVVLVGCQAAEIREAEAFVVGGEGADPSAAAAELADADRKFLVGPAWGDVRAGISRSRLLNVDPADRKYYAGGAVARSPVDRVEVQVHPADIKYLRSVAVGEAAIHPADIKFLRSGEMAGESIHPADVKFYSSIPAPASELREIYLSLHPADRKFLSAVGTR